MCKKLVAIKSIFLMVNKYNPIDWLISMTKMIPTITHNKNTPNQLKDDEDVHNL
ncbi:hypothetical protein ACUL41_15625 [Virgibacillus natechei]